MAVPAGAGLTAYRLATVALAPIIPLFLRQRALRGKEDPARIGERLGKTDVARPAGPLIWIHGVSVGESIAALPLVDHLLPNLRARTVLVTSGTVTSAALMGERLPGRAIHQFVPVDTPKAVARFLDHWQPDAALFVESELWPNTLRNGAQSTRHQTWRW